jgi:hypothetical protein
MKKLIEALRIHFLNLSTKVTAMVCCSPFSSLPLFFGYWFDASGNVRLRFDSITEFTSSSILG